MKLLVSVTVLIVCCIIDAIVLFAAYRDFDPTERPNREACKLILNERKRSIWFLFGLNLVVLCELAMYNEVEDLALFFGIIGCVIMALNKR